MGAGDEQADTTTRKGRQGGRGTKKGIGLYRARGILLQTPTGGGRGIDEIKEEYA